MCIAHSVSFTLINVNSYLKKVYLFCCFHILEKYILFSIPSSNAPTFPSSRFSRHNLIVPRVNYFIYKLRLLHNSLAKQKRYFKYIYKLFKCVAFWAFHSYHHICIYVCMYAILV